MSYQLTEQIVHDRVNLLRLVRRLDKTIASREWEDDTTQPGRPAWIKTQGMLQKLKYARSLLKNLELRQDLEDSSSSTDRLGDLRKTIDRLERVAEESSKRVTPQQARPPPLLSRIPLPPPSTRIPPAPLPLESAVPDSATSESLLPTSDLTPLPSALPLDTSSLLPASSPKEKLPSSMKDAPAFLQTSAARHEEMTAQLAAMAEQLKRNAVHFAGSLDKDKAVVLDAQEKIEKNYDTMSTERVRLRDHSSKSWGTTWLVILSMIVAAIGFILTFFVIRLT